MNNVAAKKIMEFPVKSPYKPDTAERFLTGHDAFVQQNPAAEWLQNLRKSSAGHLARQGLPVPKLERWKYTNLLPVLKNIAGDVRAVDISCVDPEGLTHRFSDIMDNTPDWLQALKSKDPAWASYNDDALWFFANAYAHDGVIVDVPAGHVAKTPVVLNVQGQNSGFCAASNVFRLGQGAELTIIEHHNGGQQGWSNPLTQIEIGPNAKLRHYRIQNYGTQVAYTQNTHVTLDRDASYEAFTLMAGAAMSRNQVHIDVDGENADCLLRGINLMEGAQHTDTTFTIEHRAPHCHSNQFIRTVLDDQARGVFQGKVHVHEAAQKTDAYQHANAMLLSEGTEMDTKPELEIYADDVICSHGTTTGHINDTELFYLKSRGIPEDQARTLLIEAFLAEVLADVKNEDFEKTCRDLIEKWLQDR